MTSPGGWNLSSTVEVCVGTTTVFLFFLLVTSTALHTHEGGLRPFCFSLVVGILLGRFLL